MLITAASATAARDAHPPDAGTGLLFPAEPRTPPPDRHGVSSISEGHRRFSLQDRLRHSHPAAPHPLSQSVSDPDSPRHSPRNHIRGSGRCRNRRRRPGIDATIPHATVSGNVGYPLTRVGADEIVDFALELADRLSLQYTHGAFKPDTQFRLRPARSTSFNDCSVCGKIDGNSPGGPRDKLMRRIRLTKLPLEVQGARAVFSSSARSSSITRHAHIVGLPLVVSNGLPHSHVRATARGYPRPFRLGERARWAIQGRPPSRSRGGLSTRLSQRP